MQAVAERYKAALPDSGGADADEEARCCALLAAAALACSKKQPDLAVASRGRAGRCPARSIDSLWAKAELAFRRGWWREAQTNSRARSTSR